MFQGSSSASPQASGSSRGKEVYQVNDVLYSLYEPEGTPTMQILFFHGLPSGDLSNAHISTWKSAEELCIWPQDWLSEIFPKAHIFTISYSACAEMFDMYLLGENLTADLMQGGIGQITSCPVILVGHCVGGLVIKETCCQAHAKLFSNKAPPKLKEQLEKFLKNIKGIFYYSTPHHGSSGVISAANGPLFKYFRSLYAKAERLNSDFDDVELSYEWQVFGLGASLSIAPGRRFPNYFGKMLLNHSNEMKVPEASSRQGNYFLMVNADHNSICQPKSKIDKRFTHLRSLIEAIAIELKDEVVSHEDSIVKGIHHQNFERKSSNRSFAAPTTVLDNSGYVPIKNSHVAVIAAIEKLGGVHVILLCGGLGKGKSTLAWSMYEHYGKDGGNDNLFEHVIWLSCTSCSIHDIPTKQFEVLQDHFHSNFGNTLPQEKSFLDRRIAKEFQSFLGDKKILMILDDVSDSRFLYEMWKVVMGAKHVKYLVTSQRSDICNNFDKDSLRIVMGDPTEGEAKAILASHVGLQDQVIPNQLQDIAKKMIEITEGNPLALACLASHFAYNQDNEDKWVWQRAYRDLQDILASEQGKVVIGNTQAISQNLWAAMKMCIESLDSIDARKLLSWIYVCKGELVPEVVLRIWHANIRTGTKTSRSPFTKSIGELFMRELVKISSSTMTAQAADVQGMGKKEETQQPVTIWSLRPLVKLYMQQNMVSKGEITSLIDDLIGNDESSSKLSSESEGHRETKETKGEERRIAIVLCALYFDRQHIDSTDLITRARIARSTTDFYDNVHDLRRKALEPIVWLLDNPFEEGQWTHSDAQCVRKVLLTYICNRELDDESISHLLKLDACTRAQLAILKVIGEIFLIEEKTFFRKRNIKFMLAIVQLLTSKEGFPTQVQERASWTLLKLSWKANQYKSTMLMLDTPGILDVLVSCIGPNHPSHSLRDTATMALGNLASGKSASVPWRIANQEGVLVWLVKHLSAHDHPSLQEGAALALQNLAGRADDGLKLRIANEDGALAGLVKCLALYDHPNLQVNAAYTLGNLAMTIPIKWSIANEDGALNGLVKLLFLHDKPKVQTAAEAALANLFTALGNLVANCAEPDRTRFADKEGVLASFVKLLDAHNNLNLQKEALRALSNLLGTESIAIRIGLEAGAVDSIVKLMTTHDDPHVQQQAADALKRLAATDDNSLKLQIALCIGNPEGALLLQCLCMRDRPGLQKQLALALGSLAKFEAARAILKRSEGLLKGLSSLLEDGIPPGTQYCGALALTLINPTTGKDAMLTSAHAYNGRAQAFILLGMNMEALFDLNLAVDLLHTADAGVSFALKKLVKSIQKRGGTRGGPVIDSSNFSLRCFVKAKIGDFEGALADSNEVVVRLRDGSGNNKTYALLERGVLKRMMGDLEGALADFDEGLEVLTDDYETLKHRGYVKFLLKDEDGARTDAEWALRIKPRRVDREDYGTDPSLGASPAEYMGYKLK